MPRKWEPVRPRPEAAAEALTRYGHDLIELARQGTFAPLGRRDGEVTRVFEIFGRRQKNNPVLIGEPEGDRLPIVREVVRRIAMGEPSGGVRARRIVMLDVNALAADCARHGELEDRLKAVFEAVRLSRGELALLVEDIPLLVGAGEAEHAIDVAVVLVPALARGEIQLIGTARLEDYQRYIERDAALQRRFQEVIVRERLAHVSGR